MPSKREIIVKSTHLCKFCIENPVSTVHFTQCVSNIYGDKQYGCAACGIPLPGKPSVVKVPPCLSDLYQALSLGAGLCTYMIDPDSAAHLPDKKNILGKRPLICLRSRCKTLFLTLDWCLQEAGGQRPTKIDLEESVLKNQSEVVRRTIQAFDQAYGFFKVIEYSKQSGKVFSGEPDDRQKLRFRSRETYWGPENEKLSPRRPLEMLIRAQLDWGNLYIKSC